MTAQLYSADELEILSLARTPGLTLAQCKTLLTTDHYSGASKSVEDVRRLVKAYLDDNAQQMARAAMPVQAPPSARKPAAVPMPAAVKPKPTRPVTLAELDTRIHKLRAEMAADVAPAARAAAVQEDAQRLDDRRRIEAAFGTTKPRGGCTFDGVVQTFN